jgi:hypothetical protein
MIDPFVAGQVHVFAGAERLSALDVLGALINERTLRAREWHGFVIALEQILTDLRADCLEEEAEMREQRIVAQDRMPSLEIVADTNQAQRACGGGEEQPGRIKQGRYACKYSDGDRAGESVIARR